MAGKRRTTEKTTQPTHSRRGAKASHGLPNLARPHVRQQAVRRRIVTYVSIALMALGLGIMAYPFIPMFRYEVFKPAPELLYQTRFTALAAGDEPIAPDSEVTAGEINLDQVAQVDPATVKPAPSSNRFVIPKIGVDVEIVEGKDQEAALNRGIWHIPQTSTPDQGGNFVLSGHRFRFLSGNRTLYLLDRLEKGDPIIVFWKGKEYDYVVRSEKIVKPTAVEILNNTEKPQLTIFTCSPLFSTKERLVLIAKPV
ncbi:MAG: sortase [Candidatus Kerfeldbacteria bacterium]|nr:sortase [Candidatus Kerfeldbacteria bacterium]